MKIHRSIISIIIALLCNLPFAGCKAAHTEEEKPPKPVVEVMLAQAEIADLTLAVRAPATIFPREQANLAARITARIVKLNARKGDRVNAGQVLAVLENRDLLAQRDEARAAIAEAEANLQKTTSGTLPTETERGRGQVATTKAALDQAQKIYDRRKALFDQGAIPQRELLVSETELAQAKTAYDVAVKSLDLLEKQSNERDIRSAQSRVEQARAKLAEMNAQLEFTTVLSPFAGVITEQMMYPGDLAKPDAPIFTVMNLSVAIARAQVPEANTRAVRQGQACSFAPTDQRPEQSEALSGRITTINQSVDPQRRTVEIWCEIPNGQRKLKGGEFGTVSITTGSARQSVVVPVAAVQFAEEGGKGTVMVVDGKNIAHLKEVETGEVVEGKVRIMAGLKGDETVIVEGGYSLPDGTEVHKKESEKDEQKGEKDKDSAEKKEKDKE
ncbi:MAG: efflux RND transporter periplasmic adaptor subunit [Acidobacteria bacterium]|nr:efflux RND transporter periplasmic adaptor subunit [Acidobacteriota bacterium]MBI3425114.1 efflux RND transporter periplasmic adaptor subunit [Acidobacteriota bacterium]